MYIIPGTNIRDKMLVRHNMQRIGISHPALIRETAGSNPAMAIMFVLLTMGNVFAGMA